LVLVIKKYNTYFELKLDIDRKFDDGLVK